MEALDVEVAAEYLVIAATLVFLKSRSLLPPIPAEFVTEGEETPEMVEERLRQRLIAYSKYREAGDELRRFLAEAGAHYFRDGGDATSELRQRYSIVPDKLGLALLAALRAAKEDKRTIVRDLFTVAHQMSYVLGAVRRDGAVLFSDLCSELDRDGHHRDVSCDPRADSPRPRRIRSAAKLRRHPSLRCRACGGRKRDLMQTELVETGELRRKIEALLFVASEALSIKKTRAALRG